LKTAEIVLFYRLSMIILDFEAHLNNSIAHLCVAAHQLRNTELDYVKTHLLGLNFVS
jgi:hypothetical protein